MCSGVRHFFEEGRVSRTGYLRPNKQLLVDLFVTGETLGRALDLASKFFLAMEDRGHQVVIAPNREQWHRPELLTGEKTRNDSMFWESWQPIRPTVVYVGTVAFGLTVYEASEEAEIESGSIWTRCVRVTEAARKRRSKLPSQGPAFTHLEEMPSGQLALRAYSPYPGVEWEQRWREEEAGNLLTRVEEVSHALKRATKTIAAQVRKTTRETARGAEEQQRRWELEKETLERQAEERRKAEADRRKAEAYKQSREQLLALIDGWSLACRIESFFENLKQRAETLDGPERDAIFARLETARQMLGGTDVLKHFEKWKSPRERYDPPKEEDDNETA